MTDQAFRLRELVGHKVQEPTPGQPRAFFLGLGGVRNWANHRHVIGALVQLWQAQGRAVRVVPSVAARLSLGDTPDRRGMAFEADFAGEGHVELCPGESGMGTASMNAQRGEEAAVFQNAWADPPENDARLRAGPLWTIVDLGFLELASITRFAECLPVIVVVTGTEPLAVMEAYKLIKAVQLQKPGTRWVVVLQGSRTPDEGREMGRRLQLACTRFMGFAPAVVIWERAAAYPTPVTGSDQSARSETAEGDDPPFGGKRETPTEVIGDSSADSVVLLTEAIVRSCLQSEPRADNELHIRPHIYRRLGEFAEKTGDSAEAIRVGMRKEAKATGIG